MSEAAIVLWIIGFVVATANIGFICDTVERIAELKFGKPGENNAFKWISVKEKLPTAAGEYLTLYEEGDAYINFFDTTRKEFNFYHEEVKFWTYLPKKVTER